MSDCVICYEKLTAQLRKPVTCPFCEFTACTICLKKYLTTGLLDAHCMGCRRAWNDEFLDMNFTKAFRTGAYKKHREDVLLDREIALLPTRQPRVEAMVKLREAEEENRKINVALREWEVKRQEILRNSSTITRKITRYSAESQGRAPPAWTLAEGEKAGGAERAKFIMKCPDGECRGFLSTAYKCGTCQRWACPDCLVVKGLEKEAPHTCDPGVKDTVALIIKESKACPKCGERISKIDGCDQMWCVDCHTAFSWTTGQLVTGVVHNPHYYEFLRKQGGGAAPRNAGDVPCGGVPYYHILQQNVKNLERATQTAIMAIHRITAEITDFRLRTYQGHFNVDDNGDLGMMYLLKDMDKEQVKVELGKRELKRNKHLAIRAILEMFVNTSTMMLNNIVSHPPGEETQKKVAAVKKAVKEQTAAFMNVRVRIDALTTSMAEKMEPEKEKEYMELRTLQPQMESELETLRKSRDTLQAELNAAAEADFAPVLLAYTNLRTYVNESLMGVSRMKACSVPQIGDDWSWKAFNKCAPKKRGASAAAPAAAEAAAS